MSKIMDRMMDLQAVDWTTVSVTTIDQWEQEALFHDTRCRCHRCAVFFARMSERDDCNTRACAIAREIVTALRGILASLGKL